MVSVGAVTVILKLVVVTVVMFCEKFIGKVMNVYASARLHVRGRAPIIHGRDTFLFQIPVSMIKYRRYPVILLCLVSIVLLTTSEVFSEAGVDVSKKCGPKKVGGEVTSIHNHRRPGSIPNPRITSSISKMSSTTFLDGNLKSVVTGFPLLFEEWTCIDCFDPLVNKQIIGKCNVRLGEIFDSGTLEVGIERTDRMYETTSIGFNESIFPYREFHGYGDLTINEFCNIFVYHEVKDTPYLLDVQYMEYTHQEHCLQLFDQSLRLPERPPHEGEVIWATVKSEVKVQRIQCDYINDELSIPIEDILNQLRTYRSYELENMFMETSSLYNEATKSFSPMTSDYFYKAVQSYIISSAELESGDYFEYKECGSYNWVFMTPFMLTLINLLGISSVALKIIMYDRKKNSWKDIPYTSRNWLDRIMSSRRCTDGDTEEDGTGSDRRFFVRTESNREGFTIKDESSNVAVHFSKD